MIFSYTYLEGLNYQTLYFFPGVYFVQHPTKINSSYVISSYSHLGSQQNKKAFFKLLEKFGQKEIRGDWTLHHIVEKQHLKSFYSAADVDFFYKNVWPVVLIHEKEEHWAYNQILHRKETETIYNPKDKASNLKAKQERLGRVRNLYKDTYKDNFVLRTIAMNVLKKVRV